MGLGHCYHHLEPLVASSGKDNCHSLNITSSSESESSLGMSWSSSMVGIKLEELIKSVII